ncbi:diguanylate cyclase [Clostridium sp. C2-6-12]|uniref:diguanylate cyclase domain-containing protein n=1 Tax=Clostridium sp. C2-6-12 TaxID=2698832 RepID=UPI00136C255C|nr:diguanylate cyclase [Clostridium sp. C2-6-12]
MKEEDMRNKINAILKEGNDLRYIDSKRGIETLKYAIDLCKEINYVFGEKLANLYMAHCYHNIGKGEKAILLLIDSLRYFIIEEFYDLQWMAYNILGVLFLHAGDIERSMDFHDNAQMVAEKIDFGKKYHEEFTSKKAMVMTFNNIAENYKKLRKFEDALAYCIKAYDIDEKFDYALTKGLIILSLGEVYYELEDYEKADKLSFQALKYLKKYNHTIAEADAYKLMALSLWKRGFYDKVDEYFHIAMELNEKEALPNYKIEALISYAEYLKDRKRINEALEILISACNLSLKYKIPEKVSKISIMLSTFYGELGDYENAFKYTKLHYEQEEVQNKSYYSNVADNLSVKKKLKEIEKENNKIVEKNINLQMQRESLQMLVEKISIISELGQKMTSTLDMETLMEILHLSIKSFMNLSYFAVGLYDEENYKIDYLYTVDRGQKGRRELLLINESDTFAWKCIQQKDLIVINDISKEFDKYIDQKKYEYLSKTGNNAELNSFIFCPLIVDTKTIGIITIQSTEKDAFTPYHVEMVKSLSAYAAIALNNVIKSMELKSLNELLLSLSEEDKLTGIANRRKFDDYMDHIWNSSIKDRSSIALLIIDIDYFKEYNDNLGHVEGDKCITKVANALKNMNIKLHFIARYGGDEFMVVLEKSSIDQAVKLAENIKSAIAELNIPHEFSKISDRVTLSIGAAAVIPNENMTIKDFIREADKALYSAKKSGRNQVAVCTEE